MVHIINAADLGILEVVIMETRSSVPEMAFANKLQRLSEADLNVVFGADTCDGAWTANCRWTRMGVHQSDNDQLDCDDLVCDASPCFDC
ncbi:hypothetical protein Q0812_11785 [Brevundimonas sp. 2R-24]|uniref:Uncharacterized protein n=1 Tax=Peiella sedimenti TaxID=3061083 RepID=A0ABT8SRD9_9CAUL|nr:hypothetical protein [Caulobacteraceae bacterium XZ-24]